MKDPERVRNGRLGGLTTAARGTHVTGPGRAAWEARLRAEFGIPDTLPEPEMRRRMDAAMRVRMARVARARWAKPRRAQDPRVEEFKKFCERIVATWYPEPPIRRFTDANACIEAVLREAGEPIRN